MLIDQVTNALSVTHLHDQSNVAHAAIVESTKIIAPNSNYSSRVGDVTPTSASFTITSKGNIQSSDYRFDIDDDGLMINSPRTGDPLCSADNTSLLNNVLTRSNLEYVQIGGTKIGLDFSTKRSAESSINKLLSKQREVSYDDQLKVAHAANYMSAPSQTALPSVLTTGIHPVVVRPRVNLPTASKIYGTNAYYVSEYTHNNIIQFAVNATVHTGSINDIRPNGDVELSMPWFSNLMLREQVEVQTSYSTKENFARIGLDANGFAIEQVQKQVEADVSNYAIATLMSTVRIESIAVDFTDMKSVFSGVNEAVTHLLSKMGTTLEDSERKDMQFAAEPGVIEALQSAITDYGTTPAWGFEYAMSPALQKQNIHTVMGIKKLGNTVKTNKYILAWFPTVDGAPTVSYVAPILLQAFPVEVYGGHTNSSFHVGKGVLRSVYPASMVLIELTSK